MPRRWLTGFEDSVGKEREEAYLKELGGTKGTFGELDVSCRSSMEPTVLSSFDRESAHARSSTCSTGFLRRNLSNRLFLKTVDCRETCPLFDLEDRPFHSTFELQRSRIEFGALRIILVRFMFVWLSFRRLDRTFTSEALECDGLHCRCL